ncbi:3-oxoacyl-[acyl-carrier-protein] synthase-3 [Thermoanaerobacter thermohydrosulfuricus]|uniref:3-oxoacyl-[acyl-carrier-protein] synthase-3 n=1 Tax=Thermoanaerobacter thermohydrosulfuricus TaxID=1516 RepID=A0A1G7P7A4_THETY|nr:3-oxoacyl-ACP synthase [Thermoanaerobacter thermohydrosulfuricus]SDF82206.1 3-oxoacyl-[acyl-carrier-protein] synthase-3 [Thermoanaerobacter thermohydrosulfuricus]
MERKDINVGIVGTGLYIPETYMTAEDIAKETGIPEEIIKTKFGIIRKPISGPEDHTCHMGIQAAKDCLRRTGVDPKEIDLIIYIGEEHKEYLLWTSGIKLQYEIGAENAWAFDMALRCGTAVAALKIAKDMMVADDNINTVMIAGGYRNVDFIDYKNPRVSFMYDLAAGGGAILLKKNYNRNIVLEASIITDGSFSEDVAVVGGGTKYPVSHEMIDKGLYKLDVLNMEHMKKGLEEKSMPNFLGVIKESLRKSGYTPSDIGYLAILHMKRSAHEFILNELGLSPDKSIYLENYGHMGQIDQILSTQLALEEGKIKDGDVVVWVSAGIGYVWDAITIKWGPIE